MFSLDGKRVVTASEDNTARVWDAESGRTLATLTGHQGFVNSAVFSPDGKRVVTVMTMMRGTGMRKAGEFRRSSGVDRDKAFAPLRLGLESMRGQSSLVCLPVPA